MDRIYKTDWVSVALHLVVVSWELIYFLFFLHHKKWQRRKNFEKKKAWPSYMGKGIPFFDGFTVMLILYLCYSEQYTHLDDCLYSYLNDLSSSSLELQFRMLRKENNEFPPVYCVNNFFLSADLCRCVYCCQGWFKSDCFFVIFVP